MLCTIAGFDPTGGAGRGVDLAVFEAFGARGVAVTTVETEQDAGGLRQLGARDPAAIGDELARVLEEDDPAAVKIGALGTLAIAEAVAQALADAPIRAAVLDPVLGASAGGALLEPEAVPQLVALFGPTVDLVTPNLPEGRALLGDDPGSLEAAIEAGVGPPDSPQTLALAICNQGWSNVLLKGGHGAEGEQIHDILTEGRMGVNTLSRPRLPGPVVRGTGCALSAAIAGYLGEGEDVWAACAHAGAWLHALIAEAQASGRVTLDPGAVALPSREGKE